MLDRGRRLAASLLAISLLAAMLFAVDALRLPSPAEARCDGPNNPIRSTYSPAGVLRASETAGADTCNGNNFYAGILKDERRDGFCVSVYFMEGNTGGWIRADGGRVCGVGNTSVFSWTDHNGNSRAYERFCTEDVNDPGFLVGCGWGSGYDEYGTNWGY